MAPILSVCVSLKNRSRISTAVRRTLPVPEKSFETLARAAESFAPTASVEIVVADFESTDWPLDEWLAQQAGKLIDQNRAHLRAILQRIGVECGCASCVKRSVVLM